MELPRVDVVLADDPDLCVLVDLAPHTPRRLSPVERAMAGHGPAWRLQALAQEEARRAAERVRAVYDLVVARSAEAAGRAGSRADDRHDPAADRGWGLPEGGDGVGHLRAGVPESVVEEVRLIQGVSRTEGTVLVETALVLVEHLPATLAELSEGRVDWPRARKIARELSAKAREGKLAMVAAVEAAVLPRAAELSVKRLEAAIQRELAARDAADSEQRRARELRSRDVRSRHRGHGIGELTWTDDLAVIQAAQQIVDRRAALAKQDGDLRPIGVIRAEVLSSVLLNPADPDRPEFTARLVLLVPVAGLGPHHTDQPGASADDPTPTSPAGTASDTEDQVASGHARPRGGHAAELGGQPITMAHARELLERLGFLPGAPGSVGLRTPDGCSTEFAFADAADGRLLAVATEAELRAAVRRGCDAHPDPEGTRSCDCPALGPPPSVDRYRPSAALERFVRNRDRQCRVPGCANRSGWSDLDHVVPHADGGETSCENLCCLCRRDHWTKTHVPGWRYRLAPDGTLYVTTPSGITRAERPPGTELLGLTRPADWPDPDPPPF